MYTYRIGIDDDLLRRHDWSVSVLYRDIATIEKLNPERRKEKVKKKRPEEQEEGFQDGSWRCYHRSSTRPDPRFWNCSLELPLWEGRGSVLRTVYRV